MCKDWIPCRVVTQSQCWTTFGYYSKSQTLPLPMPLLSCLSWTQNKIQEFWICCKHLSGWSLLSMKYRSHLCSCMCSGNVSDEEIDKSEFFSFSKTMYISVFTFGMHFTGTLLSPPYVTLPSRKPLKYLI